MTTAEYEKRIAQLLEANNAEVERRRKAEREAHENAEGMRVFMTAYARAMQRLRNAAKPLGGKPHGDLVDFVVEQLGRLAGLLK